LVVLNRSDTGGSRWCSALTFTPYAQLTALDGMINKVLPGAVKGKTSAGKAADQLNELMNEQIARGKVLVP
jgi:multiple sugar transport system substrate-binding protein